MVAKAPNCLGQQRLVVLRDVRSVRDVLRRIRRHVQLIDLTLLGSRQSVKVTRHLDRRHYYRSPIRMPVHFTPASYDGLHVQAAQGSMLAVTRDVSLGGVGLLHDEPLDESHAIVTFDLLEGAPLSLVAEIRWTNTDQCGSYMSGGSWVGVPEMPLA